MTTGAMLWDGEDPKAGERSAPFGFVATTLELKRWSFEVCSSSTTQAVEKKRSLRRRSVRCVFSPHSLWLSLAGVGGPALTTTTSSGRCRTRLSGRLARPVGRNSW